MDEGQLKVIFTTEDNEEIEFFVLEETKLNGTNYLLVADSNGEEANALILKEKPGASLTSEDCIYDVVEEEEELLSISGLFKEIMDDEIEIQME